MKNTTAEYRINAIGAIDKDLLEERIFFLKKYIKIEDYLTNYFKDEYDFNATDLANLFKSRIANDGDRYINYICTEILSDEKYNAPIRKDENFSESFVTYIKNRSPKSLLDLEHIPHGKSTKTLDELFEIFSEDKYVEEVLPEVYEPSELEQETASIRNYIASALYDVIMENHFDIESIMNNNAFMNHLFDDFANKIINPEVEFANGLLKSKIESELKKVYIQKDDRTEVEKVEQMEIGAGYVTIPSLLKLTNNELNAVASSMCLTKPITMGGDDDEEIETIEEPEVIATLRAK